MSLNKDLLVLARKTIEYYLENKELKVSEEIKKKYSEKKASFVTLTKDKELRGCIGSLYPRQELWKDVQENAINAAFHDFRFSPLTKQELSKTKIEISILSVPKKIIFKDEKELLKKINSKMGIILKKGFNTSTFLPQVWEEISNKKDFLEQLSMKAGLDRNAWKNAEIFSYEVQKMKER